MQLSHRPAETGDLETVAGFPQDRDELFYCYPKAIWPFSVAQLAAAIAERHDPDGRRVALIQMDKPLEP
ncbi:hypothetical protein OE518_25400 [Pseudomonas aeruginosa]|nr:hypothetical protein [Pseudomonas aeruginosa]